MAKDENNNKITLANSLIENHDCMSTNEYRIFFTMLAAVNDQETTLYFALKKDNAELEEEELRELTINELCSRKRLNIKIRVKELEKLWNLPPNKSYEYIKKASCSFRERGMMVERVTDSGKKKFETLPYVSRISYEEGSAYLDIDINEIIIPYIAALSREYTIFKINNMSRLTSSNSIRLYEILKKNQSMVKYSVLLSELEKLMYCSYKSRNLFLKKVVDKSIELINENTDLLVSYTVSGRGKGAMIEFLILSKKACLDTSEIGEKEREELEKEASKKVGDEEKEAYVEFIISKIENRIRSGDIKNPQHYIKSIIVNDSLLDEYHKKREEDLKEERKREAELLKKYMIRLHQEEEEALQKRKEMVYMMAPEVKELEEDISELTRLLPKTIFSDTVVYRDETIKSAEVKNLLERKSENLNALLDENGFKPVILEKRYKCSICSDTCNDPETGGFCICRQDRLKEALQLMEADK